MHAKLTPCPQWRKGFLLFACLEKIKSLMTPSNLELNPHKTEALTLHKPGIIHLMVCKLNPVEFLWISIETSEVIKILGVLFEEF